MGPFKYWLALAALAALVLVAFAVCNGRDGATDIPSVGNSRDQASPIAAGEDSSRRRIPTLEIPPTLTPTPLPPDTPTPTLVPTPLPPETPTPTPTLEVEMAVTLELAGDDATTSNGERRVNFTINNLSPIPAFDVKVEFDVIGDGKLVSVDSARGDCGATGCRIRSFDNHASVKGHLVVAPGTGFDQQPRVGADLSWELSNSGRQHYYDDITVRGVDSGQPGDLVWLTVTGASENSCGEKTQVSPEVVYAGFGNKLYAVSRSSGEALWDVEMRRTMFHPFFAGGSIYYNTRTEGLYGGHRRYFIRSLDAQSGESNWEAEIEGYARGPGVFYGDTVFYTVSVPGTESMPGYHYLLALDASTGTVNWRYPVEGNVNTSALEHDGTIYFGTYASGPDFLYGVDPETGELRHQYRLRFGAYATPLIVDGASYTNAGWETLRALDLSTGREKWHYLPDGRPSRKPVVTEGNVHLTVTDEETRDRLSIVTLDAETGAVKWVYRSDEPLSAISASDESVYVTSATRLVSLNAHTGNENWQVNYANVCSPPTVVDGILYGRAHKDAKFFIFAIRGD